MLSKEELREERKKWFKPRVDERKFKRPLRFFTRHPDQSHGDISSWGYLEDMKVYAIKREYEYNTSSSSDFYIDFKGWVYNPKTCEAVITLQDKDGVWRYIHVLDPMWLVNCSKKDIECFFFNKRMYYEVDKEHALQ
ncbi:hypothetical protein Hanom_Chr15g01399231 [Helianthus anomalus]